MTNVTRLPIDEVERLLECARGQRLTNASFTWQHIKWLADEIEQERRLLRRCHLSLTGDPIAPDRDYLLHDLKIKLSAAGA